MTSSCDALKPAKALSVLLTLALVLGCFAATTWAAAPKNDGNTKDTIVLTNRIVDISGSISSGMIRSAQKRLLELDQQSKNPIWLRINSPGGSVPAGLILIDTFKALQSPVYCLVESAAYSMAAITLVFCDKKYALPHATVMFHPASYGAMGEDPTIRSRVKFTERYLDALHHEIAKLLKIPHDKYREKIRDAWWLLADEALKAGVLDGVVKRIIYKEYPVEQTNLRKTYTVQETTKMIPPDIAKDKIPKRRD